MHILHDLAIFVIFATISKNRKLLSRYRFTPPGGIAAIPPRGYDSLPPRGCGSIPPRGMAAYPPGGIAADPHPGGYLTPG